MSKLRLFLSALVLVNLLLFIWNYSFPYSNPLEESYTPPSSLAELRLLPESTEASAEQEPLGEDTSDAEAQASEEERGDRGADKVFVCGSIGPMFSAEEQTDVLTRLNLETRAELSVRVDEFERDVSYWVMIPPLESLDGARQAMRALAENGFNESFIVTDEANRNAISLGVFRSKDSAEARLKEVNALKLDSPAKIALRGSHNYWVDFKSEVSSEYIQAVADLLRQKRKLKHIEQNCAE